MSAADQEEVSQIAEAKAVQHADVIPQPEKVREKEDKGFTIEQIVDTGPPTYEAEDESLNKIYPTDEEFQTLRRVAGEVPWMALTVAFVELCERFSYYGTTAVFVNFIQRPLPEGSTTGSITGTNSNVPGALNMGQRASTGLTLFNSFWSYVMPLVGAYMADQHWGRFKTIQWSILCATIGHIIIIVSAIPKVIATPHGAIACFAVGLVIMGIGTGGFKSNVSPLITEQIPDERPTIKILKSGERVIVDRAQTVARIYLYFYLTINIGALCGQISMVYAERYVGFWLAYLLPTIMYLISPTILFLCKKRYRLVPPTTSVYTQAFRLWRLAMRGCWSWNPVTTYKKTVRSPEFWQRAKPSVLGDLKPQWMTFDDAWVDEVGRGMKACKVFLWYPLYWLAYNQMLNNLVSQAATLHLGGVPNDIINNLNPFALIILIPIMDRVVYPGIRRMGFNFTPLKRITVGFWIAAFGMVSSSVLQYYLYKTNPCGKQANYCLDEFQKHSPISVWVQAVAYVLGATSEIFASITSLEYAFMKAPKNMRSLVQAVSLFMNAFSTALGEALVPLARDPLLVWNYMTVAILAFLGGCGFYITNYKLDRDEDRLNNLEISEYVGHQANHKVIDEEGRD